VAEQSSAANSGQRVPRRQSIRRSDVESAAEAIVAEMAAGGCRLRKRRFRCGSK